MKSFAVKYPERYVQCLIDDTVVVIITKWANTIQADHHFKRVKDKAKGHGEIIHLGEKKIIVENLEREFKPLKNIVRKYKIMGKIFRGEID